VRIHEIRAVGLRGGTPKGGWRRELQPQDCVHTLVTVITDEGLTGLGSAYPDAALVRGSLTVLESLYAGENVLEPERVSEKLHQHTAWCREAWKMAASNPR
jgi:D-galactarolactone cycloisomerase